MNKKGFEMSFSWLFAILVGAIILFLAITLITKISDNQNYSNDLIGAKEISVLSDNFELGYETSSISRIKLPSDSRMFLECSEEGKFGKQELILNSELYDKWSDTNQGVTSENKYFFFEQPIESREFIVFSRIFEFPFKVATLNYLIPSTEIYCFIDFPRELKKDLERNNISNFELVDEIEECSLKSKKVCINDDDSNCEVIVLDYDDRPRVRKQGEVMDYYGNALMFAAIFSDKEIYDCQLNRLMKRTNSLIELYLGKAQIDSFNFCSTNQRTSLEQLNQSTFYFSTDSDLTNPELLYTLQTLEASARGGGCKL